MITITLASSSRKLHYRIVLRSLEVIRINYSHVAYSGCGKAACCTTGIMSVTESIFGIGVANALCNSTVQVQSGFK